ncbi:MAG: shikimate dehydrogenase [Candidatus Omnitrophica bacterium]|nr:shikimate dehydrogenase [Candidatus Omnitrophota bacterium]
MLPIGAPKIYGIFGYPVHHSLSPLMQNAAFRASKVPALYIPFEIPPEALGPALRGLIALGIRGINITLPHKERAVFSMDRLTPEAQRAGAVNTVKIERGELIGHNTDGDGFLLSLRRDLKMDPKGKVAAVIGAGGAAKGVAVALLTHGVDQLFLYNRSRNRLAHLVYHLKKTFPSRKNSIFSQVIGSKKISDLKGIDLLIQATSAGMEGKMCLIEPSALHKGMRAYETIYYPKETPFLRMARQKGIPRANGMGMLLYQGALAFEWWTGKKAPVSVMKQVLKKVP